MMDDRDEIRGAAASVQILSLDGARVREVVDEVATEEPLEIRVSCASGMVPLAVTMRTPGNDFELAAGFLFNEGVISRRSDIAGISYCLEPHMDAAQRYNIVTVQLNLPALPSLERLERHFTTSSACGVCGKATIEALQTRAASIEDSVRISRALLSELPRKMREAQRTFASTGGLHACALFDENAALVVLREDVGRHNALDKITGWALLNDRPPLEHCVLLVSGRASYELVQKSITSRIPVLCAVSAPSSLAVELARAFNLTLLGFVREDRANVYAGAERIVEKNAVSS